MKVTLNWIKEFLDKDRLDPENVAEMLTMSGTEVKKTENIGAGYKDVIIGRIIDFSAHPNADKLSVCRVDIGTKKLDIVCGAKNFKSGDTVVVALPGAAIGNMIIKRSKIRGRISEGMMCSEKELGLSSESEGIMILNDDYRTGDNFAESVGLNDIVYELEITPNRPDCLSVMGIAREISALTGYDFVIPEYNLNNRLNRDSELVIKIEDYNLCPRYSAEIFTDIPAIKSPQWLRNRLMLCDVRPVDLIVDLTNYVMLETGQPLHAFDKDLLCSEKIIIRRAKKGEKIRMIDGSLKILDRMTLVIADEEKPVAIAGIMGGKDTEINSNTRNVLLESANFYGPSIMRSSKRIGLRSEASNRFEKKIDPYLTLSAIGRFEDILNKITGSRIKGRVYDNYKKTERQRNINLRISESGKILGKNIGKKVISDILSSLKINNKIKDDVIETTIPSFRYEDLEREIDLIEEIARIYGYNKFDSIPTLSRDRRGKYTFYQKKIREIRQSLCDIGLSEVINYSFIGDRTIERFKLNLEGEYKDAVEILNPINEDFKYLRTSLLPSLIKNLADNINYNIKNLRIFEISKVFKKRSKNLLPEEINKLGIMLTGKAVDKNWNETERNVDFYDLKGILEYILNKYYSCGRLRIKEQQYKFFHPRISGAIDINEKIMGIIGKIHPMLTEEMEINQEIFYMELDLDNFIKNIKEFRKYRAIPLFPSIDIDIAVVVDEKIKNEDIIDEIKKSGSKLLKNIKLFDTYRGAQIEKNKKSMAYSLSFRDDSRTLRDTEVDIIIRRILENLGRKFNAKIRE